MAEKYDKNGYNSSDFKRNSTQESSEHEQAQDGEEHSKLNEKAGEYMRELLSEKIKLNNSKFPISVKLIDQEVTKVQTTGRIPSKDFKYLDVYRERPTKVTVKVLVPVKEHPKFNFVGKLLGPKGNTMKQLQEETMCKMAILGRGSMRDRQKEEELRNSLDPKYAHLTDELHVEITALAPPAEAHARIAYALAEVKKYLIPDTGDMIWQTQMRDMERDARAGPRRTLLETPTAPKNILYSACMVTKRSQTYQDPIISEVQAAGAARPGPPTRPGPLPRPGPPPHRPPHAGMPAHRPMPAKSKVISILDRARTAMETSYAYDDPYAAAEPPMRVATRPNEPEFYYDRSHERYYEDEPYYKDEPREYKGTSRDVGTRRPQHARHYRTEPYARPAK